MRLTGFNVTGFRWPPFSSFFGLSRFFRDFPDLLGDGAGIFPICRFPRSRPINSTYEEQSRKGPRHNLDLSRKKFMDLLMALFRGAVFRHGGVALKQPIKQPTETPTSTLALMGRFPSLMGRFPTLMGRFTDFVLRGRFTS